MDAYFDLGDHSMPITTVSAEAQIWFDRGLAWCYGFNHEEAVRCFSRAVELDSTCAMAHWGIAYASGPFYNKPWEFFGPDEIDSATATCHEAIQSAQSASDRCSAVERGLIGALARRHPRAAFENPSEFRTSDDDYAAAMRQVQMRHPDDLDVIALTAEALITRTPWKLWDTNLGEPSTGADTVEALKLLEHGFDVVRSRAAEPHPGICHIHIHVLEMSPHPETALEAADGLRDLMPHSGHLSHMPSHIDVLCGRYDEAIIAGEKAVAADALYLDYIEEPGFYTSACCHDWHLMMYAAMLQGRFEVANAAAQGIRQLLDPNTLRAGEPHLRSTLEGYYSMRIHVPVRFGRWEDIVASTIEIDEALYPVTIVMEHYSRAIAHAALSNLSAAESSRDEFYAALSRVPDGRRFFNNAAVDVLRIAESMLEGELAYRQARYDVAFDHLRDAVVLDDELEYTEPWAWMHPPRHALGALLLEQGNVLEALAIYEADLGIDDSVRRPSQHPGNVWSLHGYVECLERLGLDGVERWKSDRDAAVAKADVDITASCACRLGDTSP